jgi:hypothetical protein
MDHADERERHADEEQASQTVEAGLVAWVR